MLGLKIFFGVWSGLIIFYTLYLAAVNLWVNKSQTNNWVFVLASPVLIVMILVDVLMQFTFFTLIFLDLPKEMMVTYRLQRYRDLALPTWRSRWATWICTNALNPFDPTKHHC